MNNLTNVKSLGMLVELVRQVDPTECTLENMLVLIESMPERDEDYTPQTSTGEPTNEIENRYSSNAFSRVRHGDIRGYADGARFLLESAIRITAIVLERAETAEAIEMLLKRLDLGLPSEALAPTKLPLPLTRGEILGIYRAGHVTDDKLKAFRRRIWSS